MSLKKQYVYTVINSIVGPFLFLQEFIEGKEELERKHQGLYAWVIYLYNMKRWDEMQKTVLNYESWKKLMIIGLITKHFNDVI